MAGDTAHAGSRGYTCRCAGISDPAPGIRYLRFDLIDPPTIDYTPGQYIRLVTPPYDRSEKEVSRPYSIASDPAEKGAVELIIKRTPAGISTTYCFEYLRVGQLLKMEGPYGRFRLSATKAPAVFVAGSSGMSPIRCILYHMRNTADPRRAVFYFGANTVKDLFGVGWMRAFESSLADFTFVPVVADPEGPWEGQRGLVTEALRRDLKNAGECEAYLSGRPAMVEAAVRVLEDLGVAAGRIFYDKFIPAGDREQ
jgi:Na+-transporting NADH:ubiquinone oxidoreductase subunit F